MDRLTAQNSYPTCSARTFVQAASSELMLTQEPQANRSSRPSSTQWIRVRHLLESLRAAETTIAVFLLICITVPSPVYKSESNNVLFVGGFKASVNIDFLTSKNVGLIVNACPTIEEHFGRKLADLFNKRRQQLPHVKEGTIMTIDQCLLCDYFLPTSLALLNMGCCIC